MNLLIKLAGRRQTDVSKKRFNYSKLFDICLNHGNQIWHDSILDRIYFLYTTGSNRSYHNWILYLEELTWSCVWLLVLKWATHWRGSRIEGLNSTWKEYQTSQTSIVFVWVSFTNLCGFTLKKVFISQKGHEIQWNVCKRSISYLLHFKNAQTHLKSACDETVWNQRCTVRLQRHQS